MPTSEISVPEMPMPAETTVIAEGLEFPEGPVAMPNGDIILVEIAGQCLTRITAGGKLERIALGGGPNGAAIGPDGRCYVCNNGGFEWHKTAEGLLIPGMQPGDYSGGRIEAVDLDTGAVETLYRECSGRPLRGPNDIVFDSQGGFWFTDLGKTRERDQDRTGVYYAKADGSLVEEKIFPLETPNGIGLSPDGSCLYVAETMTGRLWRFVLKGPGELCEKSNVGHPLHGGALMPGLPGYHLYDSLAVDGAGNICVATIIAGGITVVPPEGDTVRHVFAPDIFTTNICFGGANLRTAYITLSSTGKLIAMPWDNPGLKLAFPSAA